MRCQFVRFVYSKSPADIYGFPPPPKITVLPGPDNTNNAQVIAEYA